MLSVRNLRATYGGHVLELHHVSLEVPEGAVAAVLGSNGAGKTTLLRAISGVLGNYGGAVEEGIIAYEGHNLAGRGASANGAPSRGSQPHPRSRGRAPFSVSPSPRGSTPRH